MNKTLIIGIAIVAIGVFGYTFLSDDANDPMVNGGAVSTTTEEYMATSSDATTTESIDGMVDALLGEVTEEMQN